MSRNGSEVETAARRMRDLTTGSVWRHLIEFSWPLFVGNLFQVLYNTVDTFWVGRYLGADALGAVSVSFPITMILVATVAGLTMATTTLVAQFRGAGDETQVRRTVANSVILLVLLGLASTVVGVVWRVPLLQLIRTPEEILEDAAVYLGIFLLALIPFFLFNIFSAVLRGLGDSRTPLVFLIVATVTNIVLDPIFIIGLGPVPALGVAGAGWATLIAQVVAAVLAVRYIRRQTNLLPRERSEWRLDGKLVGTLFRVGIPGAVQSGLVSSAMLVVATLANTFGPTVVAAFGAGGRVDSLAFLPAQSISFAVTALVGQNLGAGREDRAKEAVRAAAVLSVSIALVMTLVVWLEGEALMRIFTDDAAVVAEGARYLRIIGVGFVPLALMFLATGALQGAADTLPPMIVSLVTLWGVRVPLAWYLAYPAGLGSAGIWWGMTTSFVLGMILNWTYFSTGRWREKVVARRAAPQT